MRRREFITLAGGAVLPGLMPMPAAHAESASKRPLVIWLAAYPRNPIGTTLYDAFVKGMQDQGYVEGRDHDLVRGSPEGVLDRLPAVIEEVIQLKPNVIMANATLEAVAAHRATMTIPVVCPALADAVHLGLIASEARPGGNVTGIEPYIGGLPAKQIDLAREIVPDAKKIGLLTNLGDPKAPPQARDLEAAGHALGLQVVSANSDRSDTIEDALQTLAREKVEVVIVLQTTMFVVQAPQIAASALEKRLPTVFGYRENVIPGGLVSYGVDLRWCFRHAAYFVAHETDIARCPT